MKRLLLVACFLVVPVVAFGRAGTLDTPRIAVPAGTDLSAVNAVLKDKRFKFAGGHYINSATDLYYAGDGADLSEFLKALTRCPGVTVDVQFASLKKEANGVITSNGIPVAAAGQWHVFHNAWGDASRVTVTAYVGEGGIDVAKLRLPEWRGGAPPKSSVTTPDRAPAAGP